MKNLFTLPLLALAMQPLNYSLNAETVQFEFLPGSEFDGLSLSAMPSGMERNGVSLIAHSIEGPVSFADYLTTGVEPARSLLITSGSGLSVDSGSINNADFDELYGDDVRSESRAMNFLESVTFSFDQSIIISQLVFAGLEQHEKFIITVDGSTTQELLGTTPWSPGHSGLSTFSDSSLGALQGLLIERGTPITLTFDTVDPLDRIPDGTGNDLSASPSSAISSIAVTFPNEFKLGNPYVIQGGANEATVACEIWGSEADVILRWAENPEDQWTYSTELGTQSPQIIEGGVFTNISPNTVWYYQFVADNGSEVIESSIQSFIWSTDIFVSPDGDDSNTGISEQEALATIDEAINRIRNMGRRKQPDGPLVPNFYGNATSPHGDEIAAHLNELVDPVNVILLPGNHFLEDTVVIDKLVDGNIHFIGQWAEGAEAELQSRLQTHGNDPLWMDPPSDLMPVVSGGRIIDGWQSTTLNGVTAWVAEIPDVANGEWYFNQLFVDGRRAERSRWPKQGWFRMDEVDNETRLNFRVSERDTRDVAIENWTNLEDVQTVVIHRWVETRMRTGNFDSGTRWVDLLPPAPDPVFDLNASHPTHGAGLAPYFFDGVFETMSEPGEWYLNRDNGRLYYIPLPDQAMESTSVIAPRLKELFRVSGTDFVSTGKNERIWNVGFNRIAFLHTMVDDFALHTGTGNSPYNSGRGAIHFQYARAPYVEACLFGHVGEWGVEFGQETVGGRVSSNIFRSMAFGAFKMWQNNQINNLQERTGWAHIHDNDIFGFAQYWLGGVGLMAHETVFTSIEHNHIRSAPHNGLNASGGGRLLRFGFANEVRKNLVHDIGQGVLSDLTAIRVSGKSPHSVVEGNVAYNVNARDYSAIHIYLDGESEYWTVRHNWIYGSNDRSINMKGWSHKIYDNVLAFAGWHLVNRRNSDTRAPFSEEFPLMERVPPEFERNIFTQQGMGIAYIWMDYEDIINPWAYSDKNLFWDMTDNIWVGGFRQGLDEFQADQDMDLNSLQTDPMFVDPLRGDFRLQENSPAISELGFPALDNRDAGIRKAVWDSVGAIWYRTETTEEPTWLPSDIPGLVAWMDAADFAGQSGPIHHWGTKTPYTFQMRQYDTDFQPHLVEHVKSGHPVVHFSGDAWMGNHEHSWRTRQFAGQFQDREFTIMVASSPIGSDQILLAKGSEANLGQWSVGNGNRFQWNSILDFGSEDEGFALRTWRRSHNQWEYYLNGEFVSATADDLEYIFDSEDILYLGSNGNGQHFQGDIGEILIFQGHLSEANLDLAHNYLTTKWNTGDRAISLQPGEWTQDNQLGALYGGIDNWAYSPFTGWINIARFPIIYHPDLQWMHYVYGTDDPTTSLWFYNPVDWGWMHVGAERDGYFESSLHQGSRFPFKP